MRCLNKSLLMNAGKHVPVRSCTDTVHGSPCDDFIIAADTASWSQSHDCVFRSTSIPTIPTVQAMFSGSCEFKYRPSCPGQVERSAGKGLPILLPVPRAMVLLHIQVQEDCAQRLDPSLSSSWNGPRSDGDIGVYTVYPDGRSVVAILRAAGRRCRVSLSYPRGGRSGAKRNLRYEDERHGVSSKIADAYTRPRSKGRRARCCQADGHDHHTPHQCHICFFVMLRRGAACLLLRGPDVGDNESVGEPASVCRYYENRDIGSV